MYCFMGSGMLSNTYDEGIAENNAMECEKIADEYAVEFAEWVLNRSLGESGLELKDDTLDKFKQEKGL